jgi:STE24 endopeptidase
VRRRSSLASGAAVALFLATLVVTGGAAALRTWIIRYTGDALIPTVLGYSALLLFLVEMVHLPFDYEMAAVERRYGLSTQTTAHWWRDRGKAAILGLVLGVAGALLIIGFMRRWPDGWWIASAATFATLMVVLAQLTPVVLLPIFFDFRPLDRPELAERLLRLAARARTPVLGVFEWRMSDRTRKANAALTGIGRTRRILVSDTLLAEHSDDEIEVILAHELSHHVHHDLWTSMAVEAVRLALAFYLAHQALAAAADAFGLRGAGDVAVLPLVALVAGGAAMLFAPVANALSRVHERRADRYALTMTGNASAFISAMKRLSAQNLAEEDPSRIVEVLLHSHPSINARIAAARDWARRN